MGATGWCKMDLEVDGLKNVKRCDFLPKSPPIVTVLMKLKRVVNPRSTRRM